MTTATLTPPAPATEPRAAPDPWTTPEMIARYGRFIRTRTFAELWRASRLLDELHDHLFDVLDADETEADMVAYYGEDEAASLTRDLRGVLYCLDIGRMHFGSNLPGNDPEEDDADTPILIHAE